MAKNPVEKRAAAKAAAEEKAALVKEASELGIPVQGKSNDKLRAAIDQAKGVGDGSVGGTKADTVEKAPKGHEVAHVDSPSGDRRTYSLEVHGKDFLEKANERARKIGGKVTTE